MERTDGDDDERRHGGAWGRVVKASRVQVEYRGDYGGDRMDNGCMVEPEGGRPGDELVDRHGRKDRDQGGRRRGGGGWRERARRRGRLSVDRRRW